MTQARGSTDPVDWGAIVSAAFQGDRRAFEQVVRHHQQPVFHLCARYLGEGPDAEDIAQETFLKAFVHRTRFDPERPLTPWLLTIARRLCIDRLRRHSRAAVASDEVDSVASTASCAEAIVAGKESAAMLSATLAMLPAGQRETVMLYHVDELSYKEIAGVLDVPVGTVMTWLHRGRSKLRKWYEAHGGAPQTRANGE